MRALVLSCLLAFGIVRVAIADTEENAEDFMAMHKVEIAFHEAGTKKKVEPNAVSLQRRRYNHGRW